MIPLKVLLAGSTSPSGQRAFEFRGIDPMALSCQDSLIYLLCFTDTVPMRIYLAKSSPPQPQKERKNNGEVPDFSALDSCLFFRGDY